MKIHFKMINIKIKLVDDAAETSVTNFINFNNIDANENES